MKSSCHCHNFCYSGSPFAYHFRCRVCSTQWTSELVRGAKASTFFRAQRSIFSLTVPQHSFRCSQCLHCVYWLFTHRMTLTITQLPVSAAVKQDVVGRLVPIMTANFPNGISRSRFWERLPDRHQWLSLLLSDQSPRLRCLVNHLVDVSQTCWL